MLKAGVNHNAELYKKFDLALIDRKIAIDR